MEQELTMRVEIADAIRADPELLRDVEAATAYLDTLHSRIEPPAWVRWELAPTQPDRVEHRPAVVVTIGDWPEYGEETATSDPLSRVRTKSADIRERAMIKLWGRLLRNRSDVIVDRINARSRIGFEDSDAE